jgi:CRP-like cAMP-binding protein
MTECMQALRRCTLFKQLDEAALQGICAVSRERCYAKGETLFHQDSEADGFHVVAEGQIRVLRQGVDGREQVLHLFGPGEMCGEVPVFQGGTFPASAVAERTARTIFLPKGGFTDFSARHPEVLLAMLAALSVRLRQFVNLIDDLSLKEVSARLAKYLLDLARHQGRDRVELDTTKSVLAARLGTAPETLSRILGKMQARGAVTVEGRRIDLSDRELLSDLAAGMKL